MQLIGDRKFNYSQQLSGNLLQIPKDKEKNKIRIRGPPKELHQYWCSSFSHFLWKEPNFRFPMRR